MSNFSANGVFNYSNYGIYSYLGRVPLEKNVEKALNKYGIQSIGDNGELKQTEMFEDYSNQVQSQIENQTCQVNIPWANLCAKIGIQATGNYEQDYAAFNNAIQLLSQSSYDGQAMAYFAGLKSEARAVFSKNNIAKKATTIPSYVFRSQFV